MRFFGRVDALSAKSWNGTNGRCISLIRFLMQLDDGLIIWQVDLDFPDTFAVRLKEEPCLDWQKLSNRFDAKPVFAMHWLTYDTDNPYFLTRFSVANVCANKFTIKVR